METVNAAFDLSLKAASGLKVKLWDTKTNKIALLFILAAIVIVLFSWHQFARRHYALSAHSQRAHNIQLKSKVETLIRLNSTLAFLRNVDDGSVISQSFADKLEELGIDRLNHERELLVNCSQQFHYDQNQVAAAQKFILGLDLNKV